MRSCLRLFICLLLSAAMPAFAEQTGEQKSDVGNCRKAGMGSGDSSGPAWRKNGSATCGAGMRGRCGKQRGDWYGASQPVAGASQAHNLLANYYTGQGYTVSEVVEKKWGFIAVILDANGKAIDHVMIDKRSGRIRSLD